MPDLIRIPSPGEPVYFGHSGHPLVVIVPDWFGRLPEVLDLGDAIAREGFRVAVLDLYDGVATLDEGDADALMTGVDVAIALAAIDETIATARIEGSQRAAAVGFSVGGWLALLHAQGGSTDAVVAYYASLAPEDHGVLPEPVLLHYAEHDEWAPGEEPDEFLARLTEHGTPVSRYFYFETVHSFGNLAIESKANPRAARLALARTVAFLKDHLVD